MVERQLELSCMVKLYGAVKTHPTGGRRVVPYGGYTDWNYGGGGWLSYSRGSEASPCCRSRHVADGAPGGPVATTPAFTAWGTYRFPCCMIAVIATPTGAPTTGTATAGTTAKAAAGTGESGLSWNDDGGRRIGRMRRRGGFKKHPRQIR